MTNLLMTTKLLIGAAILQFLLASNSLAGPGISGNGNLTTGFPINAAQIESIAKESLLPDALNPFKMALLFRQSAYQELGKSDPSILKDLEYVALEKISLGLHKEGHSFLTLPPEFNDHLRIDHDRSCFDRKKIPWDAGLSKINGKFEICLSAPRIISEVRSNDAFVKIGALVYHEIAHAYGATEDEAIAIQKLIETILSPTLLEKQEASEYRPIYMRCSFSVGKIGENLLTYSKIFKIPYEGNSQIFEFGPLNQMKFSIFISRKPEGKPISMATFSEKVLGGWDKTFMFMTGGTLRLGRTLSNKDYIQFECSKN